MADISRANVEISDGDMLLAAPCPVCGYDLRGHPDPTRCPECGKEVHVSQAIGDASRWLDLRLLDLWSIGVLQSVGGAAALLTLIAVRLGQYVALLAGLIAALCVCTATLWFIGVTPVIMLRWRRPLESVIGARRIRTMRRWLLVDALLVVAVPGLFTILTC